MFVFRCDRKSVVYELDNRAIAHDDVLQLDIAMCDVAFVSELQRVQELQEERFGL